MNNNGGVVALAGGNNGNTAYNRAYKTLHRTGSSIKPLSVYTLSLINNVINFSSLVPDKPIQINNGESTIEWPKNYNGINEGYVTATYALRQSKNTVAVQLAEEIGAYNCFDFLRNELGLKTLTENDANDSAMAMGYLENGVRLTDLAAAYTMFSNNGMYTPAYFYTDVVGKDGNIIVENDIKSKSVISSEDAWIMNRMLRNNVAMPDGIAKEAESDKEIEVIGKTGTVDNKDGEDCEKLFAGSTPEYTAAVWIGFDDSTKSIEDFEYNSPASIYKKIIDSLPCSEKNFKPDFNVESRGFCTATGALASERCPDKETGYYRKDNIPEICSYH